MASTMCQNYAIDECVLPRNLKKKTFTTFATDNIDMAGGTIFGYGEFHGLCLSATQQITELSVDQPEFQL